MLLQKPDTLIPESFIPNSDDLGLDRQMPHEYHPTKAKLIEATTVLLKSHKSSELSVDMVLSESNISKGSLYHHFEDLEDLIEIALLARYAKWVDINVVTMSSILVNARSSKDIYLGLVKVTERSQDRNLSKERFFRAEVLAKTNSSPRFAKKLQDLQQQLTGSLTDLIREAQEKNYYDKSNDPKAVAVFIQAYTLGKIVDDMSSSQVNQENYNSLINKIIKEVLIKQ
jgi:AcrR family transcriptional regulator